MPSCLATSCTRLFATVLPAADAPTAEPVPYNGGLPVDPPDLAGKEITVIDIPKLIGIGYFNATTQGIQEAAAEMGNVNVSTDGPTEGDIVAQIEFLERYIGKSGVDLQAKEKANQAGWNSLLKSMERPADATPPTIATAELSFLMKGPKGFWAIEAMRWLARSR